MSANGDGDDDDYEYDYTRLESVGDEPAPVTENRNRRIDDIPLDFKSPEQRHEMWIWWNCAWQTMILFFASQSMTFVDLAFVGHFAGDNSSDYLAAASQAGVLFDISISIFLKGFLQVLTVLCSQAFGAEKYSLIGHWLQVCLIVCVIAGIPVAILWYYSANVIEAIFGLDEKLVPLVKEFSRYSILRLWPQLFSASIRQFCLSQRIILPLLYIALVSVCVNILLNQIFIHGLGSWSGLGFKGSPIATATTNTFICLTTTVYVFYWRTDTQKSWPGWSRKSCNGPRLFEFMKQGLPLTLATVLEDGQMQAISAMAITLSHRYHGDGSWIIGAHNGLLSFLLNLLSVQWGVMKATSLRAGHYIGSQDASHAKLVAKIAFVVSTVISIVSAVGLVLCRHHIGFLFSNDQRVVDQVSDLIPPLSIGYVALSFFYIAMALLDAQGRPNVVAVAFFFGAWCVAVPLAYVLGISVDMGLEGCWLGIIIGYACSTAILCYCVYKTDWIAVLDAAESRNALHDQSPGRTDMFGGRSPSLSVISADTSTFPSPLLT